MRLGMDAIGIRQGQMLGFCNHDDGQVAFGQLVIFLLAE
jgi:hypothetical protein